MNKPKWSEWENIPIASIFEVCALSLDIEPTSLTRELVTGARGDQIIVSGFNDNGTENDFYYRCKILHANLSEKEYFKEPSEKKSLTTDTNIVTINARVRISEFITWSMKTVKWKIPTEMLNFSGATNQISRKSTYKMHRQEQAILDELRKGGFDPLKLPKASGNQSGAKKIIKSALNGKEPFTSPTSFEATWDRLRADDQIKTE